MKTPNNPGDQPKRTLFTGFDSFDYTAQDYTPKYLDAYLYCHSIDKEHLSKGFLPRCPLLEEVFNDTATSFNDIYYPPKFTKPAQPKSHGEYKLTAIRQLMNVLDWWVRENVNDPKLLCFYGYSYGPCKLRANITVGGNTLDNLITEFNYTHPAIAAELKELVSNLAKKAIDWDASARFVQQRQCWIDPSQLDPIEVKEAAAVLLYKLRHIGSIVREDMKRLPAETAEPSRAESVDRPGDALTKAERCAYQSYEYAVSKEPNLADAKDDAVYDWLKENGTQGDYELPSRETWKRQVRTGRKSYGKQKNTRRAGRDGRSTIKSDQIQSLSEISSQYDDEAD